MEWLVVCLIAEGETEEGCQLLEGVYIWTEWLYFILELFDSIDEESLCTDCQSPKSLALIKLDLVGFVSPFLEYPPAGLTLFKLAEDTGWT